MSTTVSIQPHDIPKYSQGVRLQHDDIRQQWVLLAPERMLELDHIAVAVLKLIDGRSTVDQIVNSLVARYNAEHSVILMDVTELLNALAHKRFLDT